MSQSLWSPPPVEPVAANLNREYLLGAHCPWVSDATLDLDINPALADPTAELDAWIIREDGRIVEHVTYAPTRDVGWGNPGWQMALANFIQDKGVRLKAGAMHASGLTAGNAGNRLWHYGHHCRSFSTLPARENWVRGLCLEPVDLPPQTPLWVDVRDIRTQRLYERIRIVTSGEGTAWIQELCEEIDRTSRWAKSDKQRGAPSAEAPSLWIPQHSDVAIILSRFVDESDIASIAVEPEQEMEAASPSWSMFENQGNTTPADFLIVPLSAETLTFPTLDPMPKSEPESSTDELSWTADGAIAWFLLEATAGFNVVGATNETWSMARRFGDSDARKLQASISGCERTTENSTYDSMVAQAKDSGLVASKGSDPELNQLCWDFTLGYLDAEHINRGTSQLAIRLSDDITCLSATLLERRGSDGLSLLAGPPDTSGRGGTGDFLELASASKESPIGLTYSDHTLFFEATKANAWRQGQYRLLMYIVGDRSSAGTTARLGVAGFSSSTNPWTQFRELVFRARSALEAYTPSSLLCEDYGNTAGSELFDTEGETETGVNPQTGLFHAHHLVATLHSLGGREGQLPPTLHYSARRGNEAGLGDGWAFRFSGFENRERCLTLDSGEVVRFTDEEWADVLGGKTVRRSACWIRAEKRGESAKDIARMVVTHPSGRVDELTAPSGERSENNRAFIQQWKSRIEVAWTKLTEPNKRAMEGIFKSFTEPSWLETVFDAAAGGANLRRMIDAVEAEKKRARARMEANPAIVKELQRLIDYLERPFGYLLSSRITMPQGGRFDLAWNQRSGQFLLTNISSEGICLFSADYPVIDDFGAPSTVTLTCWPGQRATTSVLLRLESLLLVEARRRDNVGQSEESQLVTRYTYAPDPTLDHILVSVEEPDGTVESVIYQANVMSYPDATPSLPGVRIHCLRDGIGLGRTTRYWYSSINYLSRSGNFSTFVDRGDAGSTLFEFDKHHRRVKESVTENGAERTTEWIYDPKASPKALGFAQVSSIRTTYREGESTESAVQSFTYNTDGSLKRSTSADGTITEWWYYPATGGLATAGLSGEEKSLQAAASLGCPSYPDQQTAPLAACVYEYNIAGRAVQPSSIVFYGYEMNGAGRLESRRKVEIRGVIRRGNALALTRGYVSAVIQDMATKISVPVRSMDSWEWSEVSETTAIWNGQTCRTVYSQKWKEDASLRTKTVVVEGDGVRSEQIDAETYCRFSRNLLAQRDGEDLRTWAWTGDGRRLTSDESWITPNQHRQRIGTQVQESFFDGEGKLLARYMDKRIVFRAHYDHMGSLVRFTDYDHLPGGLCRASHSGHLGLGANAVWRGVNKATTSPSGAAEGAHVEVMGIGDKAVLTKAETTTCSSTGSVKSRHVVYGTNYDVPLSDYTRYYDYQGRVVRLMRGTDQRSIRVEYDDLDRPTAHVMPDGTRFERRYIGLTTTTESIDAVITDGAGQVRRMRLGDQALDGTRLVQRNIGRYKYGYPSDDSFEWPNGTRVITRETSTSRTVGYSKKTGKLGTASTLDIELNGYATRLNRKIKPEIIDGLQYGHHDYYAETSVADWTTTTRQSTPRSAYERKVYSSLQGQRQADSSSAGAHSRIFSDEQGRVIRTVDDRLEQRYSYDDMGMLKVTEVFDGERRMNLSTERDDAGRERSRTYTVDGIETFRQTFEYQQNGQLISKSTFRSGVAFATEKYVYDAITERLTEYRCDAADSFNLPSDENGKRFRKQSFSHDALGNMTSCATEYEDGSKQSEEYGYSPTSHCKRISVNTNSVSSRLKYSTRGNLLSDGQRRRYEYNVFGQLVRITDHRGKVLSRYDYDGMMRLSAVHFAKTGQTHELVYEDDRLIAEVILDGDLREVRRTHFDGMVQRVTENGATRIELLFSDPFSGIVGVHGKGHVVLGPYGECGSPLPCSLGYNGLWRDPAGGGYHPGDGYRYYDPATRMFNRADSLSPFDTGGFNERSYCDGDPVNLHDPSGHVMLSRWAQRRQIDEMNDLIAALDPPPPPAPVDNRPWYRRALSTIIWGGLAILGSVVAVLLAIPTGGASLVIACGVLAATVMATGLRLASEALRYSHPRLAWYLGRAGSAIDFVSSAPSAFKAMGRMLRWCSSKIGALAARVTQRLEARAARLATIRSWGPHDVHTFKRLDSEVFAWIEAPNAGKRARLSILAHGSRPTDRHNPVGGQAAMVSDGSPITPKDLADRLKAQGVNAGQYDVDLIMCHGGAGENSFAKEFNRITGAPVTAYKNKVFTAPKNATSFETQFRNLQSKFPQAGAAEVEINMGHYNFVGVNDPNEALHVVTKNPFSKWNPSEWKRYLEFSRNPYAPVHFP